MGSPEKPLDVEMGDMSAEGKLKEAEVEVKPDQALLKKNGEVKDEQPERFTGLKKEELLKISSQPNWVRARWALFIVFWIIWVAMLVGAILIVVNAPRCKPEPTQQWYKDDVAYEVNAEEYADGMEGMQDHLPYIRSNLHSKIVLMTGVTSKIDLTKVANNGSETFAKLAEAIHEDGKGKVMIDLVVDSLPVSNVMFKLSNAGDCTTYCSLFVWKDGNETMVDDEWKYSSSRKALYKVNSENMAVVNFAANVTIPFFKAVIDHWFDVHKIDGVKIRDVSKLHKISGKALVSSLWEELFKDNNKTTRALYVYSSIPDPSDNPVSLGVNDTNTEHSPVYLTSQVFDLVGKTGAGKNITDAIKAWRALSRSVGGFVVSPLSGRLAASRDPTYAAGLNLLSMSLPGLPILRSGDELSAASPDFTWSKSNDLRDSIPLNGSKAILDQTKELIVKKVEGIQAKQSLRYDTRDVDTTFEFLDIKNDDIVAFKRKWDKKSSVLIVSNMSPNNHTVNLRIENGLMDKSDKAKEGMVLVNSIPSLKLDKVSLDNVKLIPGLTLVLETAA